MKIKETECTWSEFRAKLRERDGTPLMPMYRGQADPSWALVPPSKREAFEIQKKSAGKVESAIEFDNTVYRGQVQYFKHLATGLPGFDISQMSEEDLEALARHNGLITDLLDWTYSPYVAAFFAYSSALDRENQGRLMSGSIAQAAINYVDHDVAVWRMGSTAEIWAKSEFYRFGTLHAANYWQKAQSGLFTRLSHKSIADVETYLDSRGLGHCIEVFRLKGNDCLTALADLKDMNITFATLFPDVRGAALHANFAAVLQLF